MASKQNLQPLLDAAQAQLDLTFSASDSLDTKALGILGFDLAVGIFTLQSEMQNAGWLLTPLFVLLILSLGLCGYIILPNAKINQYRGPLIDLKSHIDYFNKGEEELVLQLLADTQVSIAANVVQNTRKSLLCVISIMLSLVSVALLVGCIL